MKWPTLDELGTSGKSRGIRWETEGDVADRRDLLFGMRQGLGGE